MSAVEYIQTFLASYGYLGMFMVLVTMAFIPTGVPEEAVTLGSGFLIYYGDLEVWPAMPLLFFGVLVGDSVVYECGRALRSGLPLIPPFKWFIKADHLASAEGLAKKIHIWSLPLGRVLFGLRFQVYLYSGFTRLARPTYYMLNCVLIVLHVSAMVGLGYMLHEEIGQAFSFIDTVTGYFAYSWHVIIGLILTIIVIQIWRNRPSQDK